MTTLTTRTLQRRVLQVGKAVANDGPEEETILQGVGLVRELREGIASELRELEDSLAAGVEAGSLVRSYGSILAAADDHQAQLGRLLEELLGAEGTLAESFVAELRLLFQETQAYRDLLA